MDKLTQKTAMSVQAEIPSQKNDLTTRRGKQITSVAVENLPEATFSQGNEKKLSGKEEVSPQKQLTEIEKTKVSGYYWTDAIENLSYTGYDSDSDNEK